MRELLKQLLAIEEENNTLLRDNNRMLKDITYVLSYYLYNSDNENMNDFLRNILANLISNTVDNNINSSKR